MNYRKLGRTGLEVSEIGFGAWGIGGSVEGMPAYGPTDDDESKATLQRAYDLGINFYDTSDVYGHGHSERLIGQTLGHVRERVIIATKVGFLGGDGPQDFSPRHIRRSLESSLERLQTDYIDLYQLHSPLLDVLAEDESILRTLRDLKEEGKIRVFGISVRSPGDGLTAISKFGIESIQVNFNLLDQRAIGSSLLGPSAAQSVGIIARTPFCFGFLTGAYSSDTVFDSTDHRSGWSPEQIQRWISGSQLFAEAISHPEGQTQSQLALRFCLSYPGVSTVIPGMLTVKEVEENVRASQMGPLSAMELDRIERIYGDNVFFVRA